MTERTEEDIISQAGIRVTLGGKEFEIRPLVIRDSKAWRAKVVQFLKPGAKIKRGADSFMANIQATLVSMPEEEIDLFFDYAKELNRAEIEAIATDEEIVEALKEVINFSFSPFLLSQKVLKMGSR